MTRNITENKIDVLVVKARTVEAKTKAEATTLKAKSKAKDRASKAEAKAKDIIFCPRGSSRPRPVLEDYITEKIYKRVRRIGSGSENPVPAVLLFT